jgi:hypothetical protein
MCRIEVLDQNEGHIGDGWQSGQEFTTCIEPASRCANPDDRKIRGAGRRSERASIRQSRLGVVRLDSWHGVLFLSLLALDGGFFPALSLGLTLTLTVPQANPRCIDSAQ